MAAHYAARVGDLANRESVVVEIAGRSIGIFNVDGEYFALRNRCVHQGGPLCEGEIFPTLDAEICPSGRVREYWNEDRPVVACPWHGWEYDLRTGELLGDPTRHVRTYATELRGEEIWVEVG